MGNEHSQAGCCCLILTCFRREEDEKKSRLLGRDKRNRDHGANHTSEVMEYQFVTPSDPTSEVPSEYHSETEDNREEGVEEYDRGTQKTVAGEEAIPVNSPAQTGPKWRLVPSSNMKPSPKN